MVPGMLTPAVRVEDGNASGQRTKPGSLMSAGFVYEGSETTNGTPNRVGCCGMISKKTP